MRTKENTERFQAQIRRVVAKGDDRSSLVTNIACVVGADILDGLRPPGSYLNSVDLAEQFKTSRTPTREAMVLLEKEGLVEILPRRRPRVAIFTLKEIREIYGTRAVLLGMVAAEVARTAAPDGLRKLQHMHEDMRRAAKADNRDAFFWSNVLFHETLSELAQNRTLQRILDSLVLRSLRLRRLTLGKSERMHRSVSDHANLIEAIKDGDAELATAIAKSNALSALHGLEHQVANGDGHLILPQAVDDLEVEALEAD